MFLCGFLFGVNTGRMPVVVNQLVRPKAERSSLPLVGHDELDRDAEVSRSPNCPW